MISSTLSTYLLTLLPRRPNHLQSDETLSVRFVSEVHPTQVQVILNASQSQRVCERCRGWPMKRLVPKKALECLTVSKSLRAMLRMADEAPEAAPKNALADPIRHPGGLREALDLSLKAPDTAPEGFRRLQKASKKASGEATSDQSRSKKKEACWFNTRRPAGGQASSKTPLWHYFGCQFGSFS